MGPAARLREKLEHGRTAILDRWRELTLDVYPERGARFLQREQDPFRNPVGHVTGEALSRAYDGLLAGATIEELRQALDGIVRIRAVQDLTPSAGVGFVFLLKRAIHEQLGTPDAGPAAEDGLSALHERIDRLALVAFDQFMECREKIYDLRLREIRGRTSTLLERIGARDHEGPDAARS